MIQNRKQKAESRNWEGRNLKWFFAFCFLLSVFPLRAADRWLVSHTDTWRDHKGTNAPQTNWQTVSDAALDATWGVGNGGFGYADNTPETSNCQTLLPDMRN